MFIEHLLRMLTSVPKIENIDMNNLENYGKDPPPPFTEQEMLCFQNMPTQLVSGPGKPKAGPPDSKAWTLSSFVLPPSGTWVSLCPTEGQCLH